MLTSALAGTRRSLRVASTTASPSGVRTGCVSECGCVAHSVTKRPDDSGAPSLWSVILPLVACAFCPACLAVWAPVLTSLGLGFSLPESAHLAALLLIVPLSVGPAGVRAYRSRAWRPLVFTGGGALSLIAGHVLDTWVLELLGAAGLVLGGVLQHRASHRTRSAQRATL